MLLQYEIAHAKNRNYNYYLHSQVDQTQQNSFYVLARKVVTILGKLLPHFMVSFLP